MGEAGKALEDDFAVLDFHHSLVIDSPPKGKDENRKLSSTVSVHLTYQISKTTGSLPLSSNYLIIFQNKNAKEFSVFL